jgi:hypothetical protein
MFRLLVVPVAFADIVAVVPAALTLRIVVPDGMSPDAPTPRPTSAESNFRFPVTVRVGEPLATLHTTSFNSLKDRALVNVDALASVGVSRVDRRVLMLYTTRRRPIASRVNRDSVTPPFEDAPASGRSEESRSFAVIGVVRRNVIS